MTFRSFLKTGASSGDVNFSDLVISIQRSVYHGIIGNCKTETSRKPMPLDERVAADLWLWKETTRHCNSEDWIFASPHKSGKDPYWPGTVLAKIIQPAAVRAGICKKVGWHTFRHTYSTLLVGNGENVNQSGAGTHAACESLDDAGPLHASPTSREAASAKTGR